MSIIRASFVAVVLLLPSLAFAADDPLAGIRELMVDKPKEAREQIVKARLGEATTLLLLGAVDASLEDIESARTELDEAATKFAALDDPLTAWLSIRALAELERSEGRIDQSIAMHERGLAYLEKAAGPQSTFSLDTLKVLGPVFGLNLDLGPVSQNPAVMKPILLSIINVLSRDGYAGALMEAGALEKADEQLAQARAASAGYGGLFDTTIAAHIGDLRQRQWRIEEARDRYLEALNAGAAVRAMSPGDPFVELSILDKLAELELLCGKFDEALAWSDRAINLAHESSLPKREADVLLDRAELLHKAGRVDAAIALYDEILNLPVTKENLWRQASIHADLGTLHMHQGTYGTSAAHLEKAIELYQQLDQPLVEAPLWIQLAEVDLQLGMHDNATDALEHARVLAKKSGGMVDVTATKKLRGRVLLDRGDRAGARAVWAEALEANPNADIRAGLLGLTGASYWIDGNREEAIRNFTKAAATMEVPVEDGKVEEMLAGSLGTELRWYYEMLIAMLAQDGRWQEAFAQSERARARAFLQMVGNHRFSAEHGADPRLVREAEVLRTEIATRERRLSDAHGDEAIRIRADLDRARQRYTTLLTRVKVTNPEYASVTNVEPLRLEDVQNDLPADTALVSYFAGENMVHAWVVDRKEGHYVRLPIDRDGLRRVVCWADSFGPRRDPRCDDAATPEDAFDLLVAPLLGTITQQKLILIPHGVLHSVPFAALRNRNSGHFLIDDYTLTYAPSASALRFLRAKETPVDGESLVHLAADGNLTVQDILSSVDLTGVNLVVLPACPGGDEVAGLTRALLYAGTPGVISTLWNIDDAASAGLMEDFYRRLTGGGSVAEALRQAQLAMKERYADPKYWAAFTLTGDPQGRWKRAE